MPFDFTEVAKLITAGLTLLNTKEARKYIDQVADLERKERDEKNKPEFREGIDVFVHGKFYDANVVGWLDSELRIVRDAYLADVAAANTSNKP